MITEGREPFRSEHHSSQTNKSKNPYQHKWAIQRDDKNEPPELQPQYVSDNEEDNKQIENNNTGIIQDMHKFAAALTSEEANTIHGSRDDEAVGNDDNIEEEMGDIDCETVAAMK